MEADLLNAIGQIILKHIDCDAKQSVALSPIQSNTDNQSIKCAPLDRNQPK